MLDATTILYVIVGLLHIGFAALLLALDFADRLNRVFALYLTLLGGTMLVFGIPPDSSWQIGLSGLFWYLNLGSSFPLIYLAACYHDRFGETGLRRIALPVLLAAAVIVEGLYLFNHGLVEGPGFRPVKAFHFALILLGPSLMAALLARDAVAQRSAERRRNLLNASLGFAFYPTAFGLHLFVPGLMALPAIEAWIGTLGLVPVAYVVILLVVRARRESGLRRAAAKYAAMLSLSPLSVIGLALAAAFLPIQDARLAMRFIMTIWLVVLVILVGYAILRHQLFGIELGVKWTVRRGTVPALLAATFFIVGQLIENFAFSVVGGAQSWLLAAGFVALMTIGYQPLQRVAHRFAEAAMPKVENNPSYTAYRRLQMYESALAAAWEDGVLTRVERIRLDSLRQKLGIPLTDASALEADFARRTGENLSRA